MADNNNPSGYTPPAPDAVPASDTPTPASPTMDLPVYGAPAYEISEECQKEAEGTMYPDQPDNPDNLHKWLYCEKHHGDTLSYFQCVCVQVPFFGRNQYFSANCILRECVGDDRRRLFLKQYSTGCRDAGRQLIGLPPAWAPYSPYNTPSTSATAQSTRTTSSQPSTSTQPSTLTEATSATISAASSKTSKTRLTTTITNSTVTVMPTPTGPADGQIPICGILQKCMTTKPQGEALCVMGDLDCICKASNSLEHNTEFNQQCVLDACYGDIGREEFLDSLFYHCKKVDKELIDIPKRWEPYLPVTFPSATPDSTTSGPKNPAPAPADVKLNVQSIVGIVIGVLLVLGIVFGLLWLWWKKKREAKKLRVENAQMLDAIHPDGFSNRINTLRGHSSIQPFSDLQGTGSAGSDAAASRHGTASTYNDATLVGSPRSTTAFPISPTNPKSPIHEYGTADEDCAMSAFVRYPGHKLYNDGQFELPNSQLRGSQVMQDQRNTQDDSASEYSARRPSYGDDSIDIRQDRESRAQFELAQRDEWEKNGDYDRNQGNMF
ncbi:hypothetical protein BKA58DRAFT_372599 [Alternaria rosae]|uniref:uncharacterized protein n=1 Tax=Alternaria rosae TaxID=1187941 RepID=UPI001E8CC94E|nr:uncharacterized protein BKA58DRAFT_372599 [Alternaria rosae]KAH6882032.1 hypothetical protein BKA58DRAFT_372599 [Alternaria rosae]